MPLHGIALELFCAVYYIDMFSAEGFRPQYAN